jgi:hypothetical protein
MPDRSIHTSLQFGRKIVYVYWIAIWVFLTKTAKTQWGHLPRDTHFNPPAFHQGSSILAPPSDFNTVILRGQGPKCTSIWGW